MADSPLELVLETIKQDALPAEISALQCYSVLSTIAQVLKKMSLKILTS